MQNKDTDNITPLPAPDPTSEVVSSAQILQQTQWNATPLYFVSHASTAGVAEEPAANKVLRAALGEPASQKTYQGKSLAWWGIQRRKMLEGLLADWEAIATGADQGAILVHIDSFVSRLNEVISDYRDIPHEQVLSGVLHLVVQALSGENAKSLFQDYPFDAVKDVLLQARQGDRLTFTDYRNALSIFLEAGLNAEVA